MRAVLQVRRWASTSMPIQTPSRELQQRRWQCHQRRCRAVHRGRLGSPATAALAMRRPTCDRTAPTAITVLPSSCDALTMRQRRRPPSQTSRATWPDGVVAQPSSIRASRCSLRCATSGLAAWRHGSVQTATFSSPSGLAWREALQAWGRAAHRGVRAGVATELGEQVRSNVLHGSAQPAERVAEVRIRSNQGVEEASQAGRVSRPSGVWHRPEACTRP